MKTNFTKCKTGCLVILQLLLVLCFSFTNTFAAISLTVNGQANGASFVQGGTFQWTITGLPNGSSVTNELWVDLNGNGVIDPVTDLLFVSFYQTDGAPGSDGPGDDDGVANGIITTSVGGLFFPVASYIFKTSYGVQSAMSTFTITAMTSHTFSVSGKVSKNGVGLPNVIVSLRESEASEFYALTDASGNYTINTTLSSGTSIKIYVPTESFNPSLSGYIVSPSDVNIVLTSDISNINFIVMAGKIITGTVRDNLGNPIQDMNVSIYQRNGGGNGYGDRTDAAGKYMISVDTGTYTVQFGNDDEPKGYLKTYYNQKYVGWNTDPVHVTSATDTMKNINAVLFRGGVIMGTFMNNGSSARGNITAFAYNAPGSGLYEAWHDSSSNFYYLFVPPGTYTVQFNLEGGGGQQVYYNQTTSWPGTPVTINSVSDTAKNINVNFTSVPKMYFFNGYGNWSDSYNWNNMSVPPPALPSGDTIIINGQCTLTAPQYISPGANLIINSGGNLTVPQTLTIQH